MFPKFVAASIRWTGSCLLSGGILWQVAENAGPGDGEVILHASLRDAVVRVDGQEYSPDDVPGSSIVLRLPAGAHSLTTHRDGKLIQDSPFTLEPGGHVVLTSFDEMTPKPRTTRNFDPRH